MDRKVIIINGPAGVGKTTISKALAANYQNSACIEGDQLKYFIVNRDVNVVAGRLSYKNGATLINNFILAKYEYVIFEYVFENIDAIDYFLSFVKQEIPIFWFTLYASLQTIKDRELLRANRERLEGRIDECYKGIMESGVLKYGLSIDTEMLSKEKIVEIMVTHIENNPNGNFVFFSLTET